jgi:hypothetical protein
MVWRKRGRPALDRGGIIIQKLKMYRNAPQMSIEIELLQKQIEELRDHLIEAEAHSLYNFMRYSPKTGAWRETGWDEISEDERLTRLKFAERDLIRRGVL